MSFPPATEMVQFAGFASPSYGFTRRYRTKRWVAPFGDPRIHGRSPLPSAFRSVPRPSSPLGTKAFTRCPSHSSSPTPSPKRALARAQRTDDRPQRTDPTPATGLDAHLRHAATRSLEPNEDSSRRRDHAPRRLFAYPCPGPAKTERPGLLHGHDSLHDFREQTTENRDQTSRSIVPRSRSRTRRSRRQRTRPRRTGSRLLSSVVCPLSSEPGGPGPTRTADLTLIRRAL